jgi:FtsP/CotA-like multicopper oxidase with cupredoxin domain
VLFEPAPGRTVPKLYDIARDGVQYAPANYNPGRPNDHLIVAPGNRLDMFVQAPSRPGLYRLESAITDAARAQRELPFARLNAQAVTQPLLTVEVVDDGTPVQTQLPQALPPLPRFLDNLGPTTPDTSTFLVFADSGSKGGNGPRFWLGTRDHVKQQFSDSVFLRMPLGATQTWKVSNHSPNKLNHPFHIHVNPFQVLYVSAPDLADGNQPLYKDMNDAAARGFPYWMDTFPLPRSTATQDGYIVIRQQYTDFAGTFVMHCHILGHEERGMMQMVQIVNGLASASTTSSANAAVGTVAAQAMQH